jgi:hypothetical protein
MPYNDSILKMYLTIDGTFYQPVDMGEYHDLVLLMLFSMLDVLFIRWKVNSTKFSLHYQASLMGG